jgi:DnaJ family protein B protein 4
VSPGITEKKLPVSLEDLCNGASKKVRFHRKVPDARGMRLVLEEVILDVPIYKGLKPGSRVKFRGEGDYVEWTAQRGDLWFLLVEKEHEVFTRRHLDLHTTIEVSLCDALCGWSRTIKSICGKQVRVSHAGPTPHGWREAYAGLGMPKYKDGGGAMDRGDLVVEVKLVWPGRIEEWQKDLLKQAFGGSGRVVG